jgi:hypothetical protein
MKKRNDFIGETKHNYSAPLLTSFRKLTLFVVPNT